MPRQFFKAISLDATKMDMSDNAKYAVLLAKDKILCGRYQAALEILVNLLAAAREHDEREAGFAPG